MANKSEKKEKKKKKKKQQKKKKNNNKQTKNMNALNVKKVLKKENL